MPRKAKRRRIPAQAEQFDRAGTLHAPSPKTHAHYWRAGERRARRPAGCGARLILAGRRALPLTEARCAFAASRRCRAPAVGRVGRRFVGTSAAARIRSSRRAQRSCRLRSCERNRRAAITTTPSRVSRLPASALQPRLHGVRQGGRPARVEAKLHRGRDLVDVLPAGAGRQHETDGKLAVIDREILRDRDAHVVLANRRRNGRMMAMSQVPIDRAAIAAHRAPDPAAHPPHADHRGRRRGFRPAHPRACCSSWNCCSTPARSRRAARSPTCCCATCRRPAWSRRRAAITARPSPMRRGGCGVPATIFVPNVISPAKIDRIRGYGAELVIVGDRYADALAASEAFAAEPARCRCTPTISRRRCSARARVALELGAGRAADRHAAGRGRRRRADRRHRGLVRRPRAESSAWSRSARRRCTRASPPATRSTRAAGGIAADSLAPRRVGELMFPIAQAHVARPVVLVADDAIVRAQAALWSVLRIVGRTRRRGGVRGAAVGALRAGAGRARGRAGLRRQHDGGLVRASGLTPLRRALAAAGSGGQAAAEPKGEEPWPPTSSPTSASAIRCAGSGIVLPSRR